MRPQDVFTAVPKNPVYWRYVEPVVTVGVSGKAQVSVTADEALGSPDELVLLKNGKAWALRPAVEEDDAKLRRRLDPGGSIHLTGVPKGSYILELNGAAYRLKPCKREDLHRAGPAASADLH